MRQMRMKVEARHARKQPTLVEIMLDCNRARRSIRFACRVEAEAVFDGQTEAGEANGQSRRTRCAAEWCGRHDAGNVPSGFPVRWRAARSAAAASSTLPDIVMRTDEEHVAGLRKERLRPPRSRCCRPAGLCAGIEEEMTMTVSALSRIRASSQTVTPSSPPLHFQHCMAGLGLRPLDEGLEIPAQDFVEKAGDALVETLGVGKLLIVRIEDTAAFEEGRGKRFSIMLQGRFDFPRAVPGVVDSNSVAGPWINPHSAAERISPDAAYRIRASARIPSPARTSHSESQHPADQCRHRPTVRSFSAGSTFTFFGSMRRTASEPLESKPFGPDFQPVSVTKMAPEASVVAPFKNVVPAPWS